MTKNNGAIDSLIKLGFIDDEVRLKFQQKQSHNMYGHTHMNVTPHIRQHVIE